MEVTQAGAGLGASGDVGAGQPIGDGQGLDSERGDDAALLQDVYEVLIDSEVEKRCFS